MAVANSSVSSWIYQNGPSRNEVETQHRYRKTRDHYADMMENGRMLDLQNLENAPAPVVCPGCEKPVITTLKSERTGEQWYESPHLMCKWKILTIFNRFGIIWATVLTVGLFTYPVASSKGIFNAMLLHTKGIDTRYSKEKHYTQMSVLRVSYRAIAFCHRRHSRNQSPSKL